MPTAASKKVEKGVGTRKDAGSGQRHGAAGAKEVSERKKGWPFPQDAEQPHAREGKETKGRGEGK